ncbi:SLAP domain-containing protein [uncultured Lactobacillus sp.]|uniref:SLAP domain-containing protein n=1 Tax=uncultured Lactobacillus sp. TaxID=153152 RepID=UPI0025E62472|nr:SLAP domain-containing protein [uncultured Lactobacillus sp.]
MKKLSKSIVTALSLATASLSVIPQAAPIQAAATKAKTSKEYKDGSYTVMVTVENLGNNIDIPFNFFPSATVTIKKHKISSISIDVDDIDDAGLNYVQVNDEVAISDKKTLTFDGSAYKNGLQNADININGDQSYCNITFGDLPASAYETVTETSATVKKVVKRTAAVYDRNGNKTKGKALKAGKTVTTYGTLTRGNVKYYKISKASGKYVQSSDIDGRYITLKNAATVYTQSLEKTRTSYKKGKKVYAYAYAILGGEKYYKLGTDQYISALSADGRYIKVMHSSAVYSKNLKKTTSSVAEGKKILTFGRTTIKNKKYYQTGYNSFISASNVDGTSRTLKKNAYIYKKSHGKAVRYKKYVLKKYSQKQTYGGAVSIKGKKYYIVGVGQYVTKSSFR